MITVSGASLAGRPMSVGEPLSAGGEACGDRRLIVASTQTFTSGTLHLTHFTAQVTETVNSLVTYTAATAAATVTLIRYAVYSVAANGDIALVASTPSDTALLAAAHTRYPKALSTPWVKQAGQRYAVGLLPVATTAPTMVALCTQPASTFDNIFFQEPRLFSCLAGQTDLPASVANASLQVSRRAPYVEMLP